MKETTFGTKMRWIAGVLYGLLFVYQLFLSKPILEGVPVSDVYFLWVYVLLLAIGSAVMCVWMFYGKEELKASSRRAIVAGTAMCVIFELMTYASQTSLIGYTVYRYWPNQLKNTVLLYFLMIFRLLLMILAAFMLTSSKPKKTDAELIKFEDDGSVEMIVEEIEEEEEEKEAALDQVEKEAAENLSEEDKKD